LFEAWLSNNSTERNAFWLGTLTTEIKCLA
jgi:hypothetical protein